MRLNTSKAIVTMPLLKVMLHCFLGAPETLLSVFHSVYGLGFGLPTASGSTTAASLNGASLNGVNLNHC